MEIVRQYPVEEVTSIQIKSALSQINVVASAEKDIVLKWTDTQRRKTEVVLENGTLTVKDHAQAALYGIVGLIWLKEDKELTLELPTDFSGTVFLESKDECIRIVGLHGFPAPFRRRFPALPCGVMAGYPMQTVIRFSRFDEGL